MKKYLLAFQGPKAVAILALYLVVILSLFFKDYLETSFYTLLIVVLSFGSFLLTVQRQEFRRIQVLDKALVFIILTFLLTTIFSKVWYWSILSFLRITSFFTMFYLVLSFVHSKKQRLSLFYFLIMVSVVSTFIGYYDFFLSSRPVAMKRFYGTIHMHVFAGGYLLLIIPLAFILFIYAKSRITTLFWGLISFLFILALFLTLARGAWLALFIQLLLISIIARQAVWAKKFSTVLIVTAVFVASLLISSPKLIFGRFSSFVLVNKPAKSAELQPGIAYDTGTMHRFENYKNSLRMFKEHPLFGIGLGNYGFAYHRYQDKPWIYSSAAHSSYLDFLVETGVVGMAGIIIFILVCLHILKPHLSAVLKFPQENYHSLALLGGIFGSFVHMGIDSDLTIPAIFLVLLLELALLFSFAYEKTLSRKMMGTFVMRQKGLISVFLCLGIVLALSFAFAVFYFQKAQRAAKNQSSATAITLYQKSLNLNPVLPFTYENIGSLYIERDNLKQAVWYFKRAAQLNPLYPEHTFNLAYAYAKLGENDKAKKAFKKTLTLGPYTTPRYYNALAQFYLYLGKEPEAKEILEEAVAHFPHTGVYSTYRYMYVLMNKHIVESYVTLARMEENAGNTDRSLELINQAQLFLGD